VRDEGAKFLAEVISVVDGGPGEFPSVRIKVSNPDTGTDYNILTDAPFTNSGASLNVKLAWATTDYHNTGNGADNSSDISQSALSPITTTDNFDGSFQVAYQQAIPAGGLATGSGAAVIDGHPAVVLEGDVDPTNIFITDAVGFFSIDEASVTATPRRQSVDIDQCLNCHQNLVLHGSNRADEVNSCVTCHNPRNTDRDVRAIGIANPPPSDGKDEESLDFKTMVHAIHASAMRDNPLQVVGFRGFSTHVYDEDHVQYPGILSNCKTCHVDGGYTLPLASTVLGNTIDTGTDHTSPVDDTVITPTAAVCYACHENDLAKAHMESNGGDFSTTQAAIDSGAVIEQCELCHGTGRSADVDLVHGID
jgi:OmcA/MtrC family decaheme c-type cytochrome